MLTRRKFLKQTAAAGAIAAVPFQVAKTATDSVASTPETTIQKNPQGTDLRIKSVIRRDETILRLGGHGDINHMSWAADDRQFVAVGDVFISGHQELHKVTRPSNLIFCSVELSRVV